jgi:hypothetical protein
MQGPALPDMDFRSRASSNFSPNIVSEIGNTDCVEALVGLQTEAAGDDFFRISVVPPKIEQKRNQVLSRRQGPARPGHLGEPGPNNWVLSRDGELARAALPYQAELSLTGACSPDQKVRPVARMSPARLLRRHPGLAQDTGLACPSCGWKP